ncbi:hypothetical protein L8106_18052 [Lyngbya sp. PCC 8106]|nr:hypothetical protein L8106_18052 [Lyngbya sp. PCC 8106]
MKGFDADDGDDEKSAEIHYEMETPEIESLKKK